MKIHQIPSSLPSQNSSTPKRFSSHTSSKPSDSKLTATSTQPPSAHPHNPHLSPHSMCEKCYKSVSKYLNSKESEILALINNIENTYFQEKENWRGSENYRKRIFELEKENGDMKNVIRALEQEIRGFNEENIDGRKELRQMVKNYYQEDLELTSKNMKLIEELNREMDTKSQILQQIQTLKSQLFIKEILSCNIFFDKIEQIMFRNITKLKDQNQ